MNRGTLPIIARLHALQTAARIAPGGARVIAAISDANPLAALLCEVNETVLGRTLTFESSGGSSLSLEVSGRRVLRVTAANGLPGAENTLADAVLDDDHKDELIKLMQAVAVPRQELRVWALPMTREVDGVSVGLPVALLADLLLIDLNPLEGSTPADPVVRTIPADDPANPPTRRTKAAPPEPEPEPEAESPAPPVQPPADMPAGGSFLGTLARAIGPELMAWLVVGGEDDGATDGPEEMVSHLQGFLDDEGEALNQQLDQVATQPQGPVCIVLGASLIEGHSILCARMKDGILLGVIDGDATGTVLRGWASALRG
ncbi:hypothetical protein EI545_10390 [Tabrizicola piscis]|uniref:Uncharacterized protein n=1 Tax=Tabrizicola piscis TaxID=2494374 RepID=A0A3S8U6J0_9RHOB|nr:hypothetical protein [Tabrizicola piscis]AZL59213.1 hypothetical protein EI545_10390 [Tabrizicola piscis]